MRLAVMAFIALLLGSNGLDAQSFGRNKPRYKTMDFKVLETPNFEINHYLDNEASLKDIANWSEQWYHRHQIVLRDTFDKKNPMIVYNNHADFQQTRAIQGMIGVGTGGVTEGLRNRVVFPFAMSNSQTNHVLGHELVHAFQYHMLLHGDSSLSIRNLQNLPLWMIEGLAEYMSIGRVDAHTAMWMRDAVINDKIPRIKDLSNPKFFPYRYGQAFWAFLTGTYGDNIIQPFFMATAKYGLNQAITKELNMNEKNLTSMWQSGLRNWYEPLLGDKKDDQPGRKILDDENAGNMNLSPVLSPDGKYLIFLSEKNLFTIDLYLADARNGKILRKVVSTVKDGHLDNFDFIESSGTWSNNSKYFAFVAFEKGKNVLVIRNVANGKTIKEMAIPGIPAFSNPIWSPTGDEIVVTGLVQGQTDLYSFNWQTGEVVQLTNDRFSELHPHWSKDGRYLSFATDQISLEREKAKSKWAFNLAVMDMNTKKVEHLELFPGADNLNPAFDNEGNLWFLSNRDGFRNLYKYDLQSKKLYQMTRLLTGISGITPYSPAFSIAGKDDRVVYSYYSNGKYAIYQGKPEKFLNEEVNPMELDFRASTLPPLIEGQIDLVNKMLSGLVSEEILADTSLVHKAYESKLELEYIGGSAGVGVGQQTFGTTTAMQGGVDLLFGDMLGDRKFYTGVALNGEIYDFAGQVAYLNQKNPLGWGASISHIPYRWASLSFVGRDTLVVGPGQGIPVGKYYLDNFRLFEERGSVFGQLPFSQTTRVEGGLSYSRIHYRHDRFTNYYDRFGRLLLQDRNKQPAPPGFGYFSINSAFVHDNSYFGIAAPLQGNRYRIGLEKYFGDIDMWSYLADYRQYLYAKPVTFAFRAMHLGRVGKDSETLSPIYIGYPWFIRGYGFSASDVLDENQISFNQLAGSKVIVGNFEVRLPFTGPERLSVIKSDFLFTDLNFFVDGGLAWSRSSDFENGGGIGIFGTRSEPVFSTGVSVRVNLFGAIVLEPYWAVPIQEKTRIVFGLNIVPGW